MRVTHALSALACLAAAACGGGSPGAPTTPPLATPGPAPLELRAGGVRVEYQPADAAWAPIVHAEGIAGREIALAFFGEPLSGELRIDVFPDRAALTAHWRRLWQNAAFQSECWMIASGDAGGVALLSPGAWARDACGHDGQDAVHRSRITFHEVAHVHHAQHNPAWGVTASAMGWLVEGLAVHVSGQLDDAARSRVRSQTAAGRSPTRLSEVLPAGYDSAGSLVAWIDGRHGRATLLDLLDETQEAAVLRRLETSEPQMLAAWRADVLAGR
jgi:hypothetical protein